MNVKANLVIAVLALGFFTPSVSWALDAAKQQELLNKKKTELNGHEWDIKLSSTVDPKKVTGTDTLIFKDMKFESKAMTAKGYNSTNYTISLQDGGGPTVWETMQSDDKGNSVFWRGEWEGEAMRGVMSKQAGGKSDDYYFSSVSSKAVADTPKEEPKAKPAPVPAAEKPAPKAAEKAVEKAAAPSAVAAAPAPVKQEAPKKKKKGWFQQ